MKRLVILSAALLIGVSVRAASYTWGLSSYDYQDHSGNPLETGTAFLYLGTVTASESEFNLSGATFVTKGGFDMDNYAYGNPLESDLQSSDLVTSTAAGQSYSIILVEDASVSSLDNYEGYYTIISGSSNAGVLPGTTPTYYADFVNATSPAHTTAFMGPVPEPTSGLLLLLGMAGLALKRKRA